MLDMPTQISYASIVRDTLLTAWAVSFASDFTYGNITDMALYRRGLIEEARKAEHHRHVIVSQIPGRTSEEADIKIIALAQLHSMIGRRGPDYTQGLRRRFSDSAIPQAMEALSRA